MNASVLRHRILFTLGIAGIGCTNQPEPRTAKPGEDPPPIVMIDPPPPVEGETSDEVLPLPVVSSCPSVDHSDPTKIPYGPYCGMRLACAAPLAQVPAKHYAAPFERCNPSGSPGTFSAKATSQMRASQGSEVCCYQYVEMHPMGRPLRAHDVALVPAIDGGRNGEAERFVEIARIEHSSVASFADLSLSLLAHGAPAELIEATHRAALDEIGHARAALQIATSLDGVARAIGPMPIPAADRSFHALVRSTVIDGCFGEVIGALEAAREVHCDPVIDGFFQRVADEEANHAVLAFQIIGWALSHDREAAVAAIDDAVASVDLSRVDNDVTRSCLAAVLTPR
jgi:hypothetical protein